MQMISWKNKILWVISAYIIVFTQCTSKRESEFSYAIMNQYGTKKVEVKDELEFDSKVGNEKNFVVTLSNPQKLKMYFPEEILSSTALKTLNDLREDLNNYDNIKVVLSSSAYKTEKKYNIERLISTLLTIRDVSNFFTIESKKQFVDANFISDSAIINIENAMNGVTKNYGQISDIKIRGFEYTRLKEYSNLPIIKIRFEVTYDSSKALYYIYAVEESKKICFIGINQDL